MNRTGWSRRSWIFCAILLALCLSACGDSATGEDGDAPDGDATPRTECETDEDCRSGFFCSPRGRCLDACRIDSDCHTGVCNQGFCVTCVRDQHCQGETPDAYCDRDYTRCLVGCEECMVDQECIENRCKRPSVLDGDQDEDADEEIPEEEIARCGPAPDGLACEPGCHECLDRNRSRQCAEDGGALSTTFCDEGDFCNARTGRCESILCEPREKGCTEDRLARRQCRMDGAGWEEFPCETGLSCSEGECINLVCDLEGPTRLVAFNTRSQIAFPDRFCQFAVNIGSAAWIERPERGGVAAFLDGTNRMQLDSAAASFYSQLSVAVDVYLESGAGGENEVLIQKGDPLAYALAVEDKKIAFRINVGNKERRLEGPELQRGRWYHIAGTFDGMTMRLYVDGTLYGEPAALDRLSTLATNSHRLSIGMRTLGNGQTSLGLKGYLDNLFLSGRAIRADEVSYLAASPLPCRELSLDPQPNCAPLCQRALYSVPINQTWYRTDLSTYAGETFFVNPGGCPRPHTTSFCIKPEGLTSQTCLDCPSSTAPRYSLLARFGSSTTAVPAGSSGGIYSPTADQLFFGYNDLNPEQNRGEFGVIVERGYCHNSRCPADMVPIPGKMACMDRYEASCPNASEFGSTCGSGTDAQAHSVAGIMPWTNITPQAAKLACAKAGKRLCTDADWSQACRGEERRNYPYGPSHVRQICNDYSLTPPIPFDFLMPTGTLMGCVNETGAFDLSGNAGEWVELSQEGTFKNMAGKGASAEDQSSCFDSSPASGESSTVGFRCCRDLN